MCHFYAQQNKTNTKRNKTKQNKTMTTSKLNRYCIEFGKQKPPIYINRWDLKYLILIPFFGGGGGRGKLK